MTEEKLDDNTLESVIEQLERAENPITKKRACELLHINYNVTRLASLIAKYKERKLKQEERKKALKGKPLSLDELNYIVNEYIHGTTIEDISESTYRSVPAIKKALVEHQIPLRKKPYSYFDPPEVPEAGVSEEFIEGQIVYSVRYQSLASIVTEFPQNYTRTYLIWLHDENWKQYAYQPCYDLVSLKYLEEKGIRVLL